MAHHERTGRPTVPTTSVTGVRTIGVKVADQDRALAFFVDILGFEKRVDAPVNPTMRWLEVAPPGARTTVALIAEVDPPLLPRDTGIRFSVPDAEGERAFMLARGVEVGDIL